MDALKIDLRPKAIEAMQHEIEVSQNVYDLGEELFVEFWKHFVKYYFVNLHLSRENQ